MRKIVIEIRIFLLTYILTWFILLLGINKGDNMNDTIIQYYIDRISRASNTINILSGSNIDHLTITAFFTSENEYMAHMDRLENRAKKLDSSFKTIHCIE